MDRYKGIALLNMNNGFPNSIEEEKLIKHQVESILTEYRLLICFGDRPERPTSELQLFNVDDIESINIEELQEKINKITLDGRGEV